MFAGLVKISLRPSRRVGGSGGVRTGMERRGRTVQRDHAETIALRALAWLAGETDLLPAFLDQTGAAPRDLAAGAANPVFLAAVLDFLLAEDARVRDFCDASALGYSDPMQARAALPGGQLPHWT